MVAVQEKELVLDLQELAQELVPQELAPTVPAKRSRRQRLSVQSRRLKRQAAGYLDYGQYYELLDDADRVRMGYCQVCWHVFEKDGVRVLRSWGCNNRVFCPGCCAYHREMLAKEASDDMVQALEALEIFEGLRTDHYGLKVVTSPPKDTSVWIDQSEDRIALLNGLFKANTAFLREAFGKGLGGVEGMDFAGESDPTEPNYHFNAYVYPARRIQGGWVEIPRWQDDFAELRRCWARQLKRYLGEDAPGLAGLAEADVWVNYLSNEGQLRHFLRYLYRSPLFDLWKGWDSGTVAGGVEYRFRKKGQLQELHLGPAEVGQALLRVGNLPPKWKRVRWFGCFSDSQRGAAMESVALVAKEVDLEAEESAGWVQVAGPYYFLRQDKGGGLILREPDTDRVWKSEELADRVDYAPKGVITGKRKRWRPPGGT